MATAKQIKEDLFSISWSTFAVANNQPQTVEVTNPDIFKLCKLSYTTTGKKDILEIEIQFSKAIKSIKSIKMESILVEASKNGIQQKMSYSHSDKWTTSFNEISCYYCPSTHTAPHAHKCSECRLKSTHFRFQILIDLTLNSLKKESSHVLDHLLNLWKTKTLADVTFKFKEKSIKAHTLILASGSPVLAAMFQNEFKENQKRVVDIEDIKATVMENLFQYIYTGEAALETDVENVAELLVAADKYDVETLKENCAIYLSQDLKVENATKYLVLAHLHNSSVLHESTLEFMSKNAKAVCSRKDWMDIIKNYPELCFQATQLMVGL